MIHVVFYDHDNEGQRMLSSRDWKLPDSGPIPTVGDSVRLWGTGKIHKVLNRHWTDEGSRVELLVGVPDDA